MIPQGDIRLYYFQYAAFVAKLKLVSFVRYSEKILDFTATRIRIDVSRSNNCEKNSRPPEFNNECVVKVVVASKLLITPDIWALAKQLSQSNFETLVK